MIKYERGRLYLLRNTETCAGSYFRPLEVIPYNGHTVLYGELRSYEFRILQGPVAVRSKPTGYSQPTMERYGQRGWDALALLIKKASGAEGASGLYGRLRVSALPPGRDPQVAPIKHPEGPEEPLYAPGRVEAGIFGGQNWKESWEGRTPNRDGLIYCSRRMLDLFDDTVRLGQLPLWFIDAQRAAHRGEAIGARA